MTTRTRPPDTQNTDLPPPARITGHITTTVLAGAVAGWVEDGHIVVCGCMAACASKSRSAAAS